MVVYALLLYLLVIFLLKNRFVIKFDGSQLIISSYFFKKESFFSFENLDLKNLFFDKFFSNNLYNL
jgi:hypothetical protein